MPRPMGVVDYRRNAWKGLSAKAAERGLGTRANSYGTRRTGARKGDAVETAIPRIVSFLRSQSAAAK